MNSKHKTELEEAEAHLLRMQIELSDLEIKVAKQKRRVALLRELSDIAEDSSGPTGLVSGITDACKIAVLGSNRPMKPAEVRDAIETLGVPEQKNLLASVHTILKRLAKAEEIMEERGLYRAPSAIEQSERLRREVRKQRAMEILMSRRKESK